MEGFLTKQYRPLLALLLATIVVFSFLLGREEGRRLAKQGVVLSCSDEVLRALAIPLENIAQKENSGEVAVETAVGTLPEAPQVLSGSTVTAPQGKYLGSKNGTKYYTPECSGAKRIKPENYVWFSDEEDARLQGYTPASC